MSMMTSPLSSSVGVEVRCIHTDAHTTKYLRRLQCLTNSLDTMMPPAQEDDDPSASAAAAAARRKGRTLSVDTGMSALVTRFYEEKLREAKAGANKELQAYIKDIIAAISQETLAGCATESLDKLEKLKSHAQQIFIADSYSLMGGRFKTIVSDIMKLKDARHGVSALAHKFINKLLLIISTFSRLFSYLVRSRESVSSISTNERYQRTSE